MIRMSEVVLPGHPDRFCDQVADAIVRACYEVDPRAYCQVEVSAWSDHLFLTGGIVTRRPLVKSLPDIARQVGLEVGYVPGSAIDATRYQVTDVVCQDRCDPRTWTDRVNDQCITVGWAGFDARVGWLPPEHFLAQTLGAAIAESCRAGRLAGEGPDGKLLVRLREHSEGWQVEHVLVTLQQREQTPFVDMAAALGAEIRGAYAALQRSDARWRSAPEDITLLINPNGPLINGGSDGDNGQTGRKLAVDYYGPRVAIGGGALAGKDLSHIDRAAAYAARQAAVHAVATGARECRIVLAYAPNVDAPLEVHYEMDRRGERLADDWFSHTAVRARYTGDQCRPSLGRGQHFFDRACPWNGPVPTGTAMPVLT
jgi:S-adenosylmethionine synthetase